MSNGPLKGAAYLGHGLALIFKPNIRLFVLLPLAINAVLFTAVMVLLGVMFDSVLDTLTGGHEWLRYILWPVFGIAALASVFFGFTLVANLIGAPFNGLLAERVENYLCNTVPTARFSWRALIVEAADAIAGEVRKYLYFALLVIPCVAIIFIPIVQLAAPLIWFVLGAWMMVIEYADYPMANHGYGFARIRSDLAGRRPLALGFGAAALLMTSVPVLNFIAMPVAVCGATAMYVEQFSDQH